MNPRVGNDPLEQKIANALDNAKINYKTDYEGLVPINLDFYLTDFDIYLEIKGGHSDRISKQTSRAFNVIVIQGIKSVDLIVKLLQNLKPQ